MATSNSLQCLDWRNHRLLLTHKKAKPKQSAKISGGDQ